MAVVLRYQDEACVWVGMCVTLFPWLRSSLGRCQQPGDACMFWMLHFLHAGETAVHAANVHPFASLDYLMVFLVVLSLLMVLCIHVFPTGLLSS